MSGAQEIQRTTVGSKFMGNTPRCVEAQQKGNSNHWGRHRAKHYAMGKKLKQTGHYIGYFWVARDKKGQTHVRGFFVAHGVPEGSQSKKSHYR